MEDILASIRRILAEDDGSPRSSLRPSRAADVLDLTEAISEDGTIRHIEPAARLAVSAPLAHADGRVEPIAPAHADVEDRLLSSPASEAAATSFARLAEVPRDTQLSERQLDGTVRDLLRPMLQAWLDTHLPALVERLVQNEIARLVGGAEKR
jgi:uncharacterized protein